jgi:hypothetical protein
MVIFTLMFTKFFIPEHGIQKCILYSMVWGKDFEIEGKRSKLDKLHIK